MKAAIWLLALGALSLACDPILGMHGTVRSTSAQEPIAGAKVTLRCLDRVVLQATTNDKGEFSKGTAGTASPSCMVRIEKDGYAPREVKLVDFCSDPDGKPRHVESGPCSAKMAVELDPAKP